MTNEMLVLARQNLRKAGVATAEFLKGEIEAIPLPDDAVDAIDVVMSDCVTGARFPVRLGSPEILATSLASSSEAT